MPALLPDVISCKFIEANHDAILPLPRVHAKTVAQSLFERKLLRPHKFLTRRFDRMNAGGSKRANIFAQMIEPKQEPFAIDVGEMVGIDHTVLRFLLARLPIS